MFTALVMFWTAKHAGLMLSAACSSYFGTLQKSDIPMRGGETHEVTWMRHSTCYRHVQNGDPGT